MNARRTCVAIVLLLAGTVAANYLADAATTATRFSSGVQAGKVQSEAIDEASGLAASRANPGVLWVHNDSGDSARVFAISTSGQLLCVYNLDRAKAVDWEDMCIGPGPVPGKDYLYLGDIGDNLATRGTIKVYRVAEPTVSASATPVNLTGVESFSLKYEDGARDAETLMVDPVNGDLYVISKRELRSRVYRAEASSLTTFGTTTLRFVAELPWGWATGGDVSPRGDEVIVRGYNSASLWHRLPRTNLWDAFSAKPQPIPLLPEIQGESIAFSADGKSYYTVSEGRNPPIYRFDRTE